MMTWVTRRNRGEGKIRGKIAGLDSLEYLEYFIALIIGECDLKINLWIECQSALRTEGILIEVVAIPEPDPSSLSWLVDPRGNISGMPLENDVSTLPSYNHPAGTPFLPNTQGLSSLSGS